MVPHPPSDPDRAPPPGPPEAARVAVVNPRLTVVIATRDRRDELAHSVRMALALPERPRVVVVDNASSDGTAGMVEAQFPSVQLVRSARNLAAAGRTVGARAATSPYVAFADDDSWWAPGSLAQAADILDAYPRVGLLAARIVVEPEGRLDPVCALMAQAPLGRSQSLPGPQVLGHLACAAVVRREAFLTAGGYLGLLRFGGEEQLLSLDLATAGWALCYVPALQVHHRPSRVRHVGDRRPALHRRNDALTAWMRRPWPVALREVRALLADAAGDRHLRWAARGFLLRLPGATARRRVVPRWLERDICRLQDALPADAAGPAEVNLR